MAKRKKQEWEKLVERCAKAKRHSKRLELARLATEAFNAAVPLETKVRYWPGIKEGEGHVGMTRSLAVVQCSHPSVWVTGHSGSMSLTHIEVI
jgi:hypothetical protein